MSILLLSGRDRAGDRRCSVDPRDHGRRRHHPARVVPARRRGDKLAPPLDARRAPAPRATGGRMTSRRFEFRVQGPLSENTRRAFNGLAVAEAPPETIILGDVVDESHLHGILALIRSLDLHLISMHEVPNA
jgi:hypothetical protein